MTQDITTLTNLDWCFCQKVHSTPCTLSHHPPYPVVLGLSDKWFDIHQWSESVSVWLDSYEDDAYDNVLSNDVRVANSGLEGTGQVFSPNCHNWQLPQDSGFDDDTLTVVEEDPLADDTHSTTSSATLTPTEENSPSPDLPLPDLPSPIPQPVSQSLNPSPANNTLPTGQQPSENRIDQEQFAIFRSSYLGPFWLTARVQSVLALTKELLQLYVQDHPSLQRCL